MTDPTPSVDPSAGATLPDALPDSVPIIPRSAWQNSSTKALADAMTLVNDPISVQRRWGIVAVINADYTLDVLLSGQIVQGISYNATYAPAVGDTVQIDVVGPDMVVMGPMAPSLLNPGSRLGTVTSVNATRTAVTFTTDDGTVFSNVPALAPYVPYVNDSALGISYQGQFYVIGSEHATAQPVRRAVGDIEPSLTVKPGTLALTGQAVSRTTYSQLWAWVQANSLVAPGLFTTGDGSTTFGLPDFRGRSPVGVGVLSGNTYAVGNTGGSASVVLATNQMPAHNHGTAVADHATHSHTISIGDHAAHGHALTINNHADHNHTFSGGTGGAGDHTHAGTTTSDGIHGGHVNATGVVAGGTDAPASAASLVNSPTHYHSFTTNAPGNHTHGFSGITDAVGNQYAYIHTASLGNSAAFTHSVSETAAGPTTHTVTQNTVGGTTPVDVRAPYFAVNYVIWT